jgi:MoaA/NifB/PqqE/SkfB family radical SAM enzyme
MDTERQESWGKIKYDIELDEFEAHVCNENTSMTVDRPLSAGCLVTGRCNLSCKFCYGNDESLPTEELPSEEWKQIFVQLKTWGLLRVDLSGGEPTLRRDISTIATHALDAGLNVVVSTNGLLHRNGPIQLPKLTRIHVSLDSGFADVHEASRILRSLRPSAQSFGKTSHFIRKCLDQGYRVRALTCVGPHNCQGLFQLGEHLASIGVKEWNISRILPAGRAKANFAHNWNVNDNLILEQISSIRYAFRWMRVRYSNRIEQNGFFLLVLPNGTLATQYTDKRDKFIMGRVRDMTLDDLRAHPQFDLACHARKWIGSIIGCQDGHSHKAVA